MLFLENLFGKRFSNFPKTFAPKAKVLASYILQNPLGRGF